MIRRFDDMETLSRAAADLFVREAHAAVVQRGRFTVALSGGRTPQRAYELLSQPPWRDRTPWPQVHVFWSDERCVAEEDERSNARMARRALLDHVPVVAENIHPIRCAEDPRHSALDYDILLEHYLSPAAPRLDLILLGLGENGHTASLFPGTSALTDRKHRAVEVHVADQQIHRVTLTPTVINDARTIVFLVFGLDKAPILKTVLEGPRDPLLLPAQLIQPRKGQLIWLVDRAAAGALEFALR